MLARYVTREGMVPSVVTFMNLDLAVLNNGCITHIAFIWVIAGVVGKVLKFIHVGLIC